MRVIKLSKLEFSSRREVENYFQLPASDFNRRGFVFPKGKIANDGVETDEVVIFTFDASLVAFGAAVGPPEEYHGPERENGYEFRLRFEAIEVVTKEISLEDLLVSLGLDRDIAQRKTRSQGWLSVPGVTGVEFVQLLQDIT